MSSPTALTSPRTIYGRGLLTFTLVWQLAWLAFDPRLWPNNQAHILEAVFIAGAMVTVLLLGADVIFVRESSLRRRVLIYCNLVMLTASALSLLLAGDSFSDGWVAGSTFVILAVGVSALVLPLSVAAVYIVAIAVIEGVVLAWHGLSATDSVLYPVYALAVGAGMASASYSLRRVAQRVEIATGVEADALRQSELDRSLREAAEESDRAIHDVVLNTLTAVERGGLRGQVDGLRMRCAEAASLLRRLISDSGDLNDIEVHRQHVWQVCARLEAAGVVVDMPPPTSMLPVPMPVRNAVASAAAEALRNVELHSGATRVSTRYEADETYVVVSIEDDGVGFDPTMQAGFGITRSMQRAMENVGGSVEFISAPGEGTKVILRWRAEPVDDAGAFSTALSDAFAVFVPSIAIGFGALTVLSAVLTLSLFHDVFLTLVDLAAYLVLLGFLIWSALVQRGLNWYGAVGAIVAAILVYRLHVFVTPTAGASAWTDWGSEAVVAVFIIVIVAGPKWVWPLSILGWVIAQGGDPWELLRPGTGVLIAATLLSFTLRRQYDEYDALLTETTHVDVERYANAEAARIRRERYGRIVETPVIALLDGIADGSLDPDSPDVQESCRIEERFVRTMMRLDPSSDAIHALVAELARDARVAGRELDVGVYGTFDVEPRSIAEPLQVFREVIRTTPGEQLRITASPEASRVVVRLVAEVPHVLSPLMSPGPGVGDASLVFTRDPEGSDGLWEVYVADAGSGERSNSTGDR